MTEEERRTLRDYIPCPQRRVVVNLSQELGVGVDLVRHGNWLGEINEFHKRFFYLRFAAPNQRGMSDDVIENDFTSAPRQPYMGP